MKSNEKKIIGVLIAIFAVIIVILLLNRGGNNNQQQAPTNPAQAGQQTSQTQAPKLENEENVKIVNDNTKLNTSSKFSETKTFEGLEISNVQLTSKEGVTQLLADVKNATSSTAGDYAVKLTILDKDGNTITEAHGYISKIEPGKTTQLNISKTFDFANAYDYKIEKE